MKTKQQHQQDLITRLRRVEGQIRGIQSMIETDAECSAIAQQLSAARKALDRSFFEMMACALQQQIESAPDLESAAACSLEMTQMLAKYG